MTKLEELHLIVELLHKHELPLSPILEYAIKEREEQYGQEESDSVMVHEDISSSENSKDLDDYLSEFASLSVGSSNGKKLPHKAILLISIMNLIEKGIIEYNRIELSNSIVEEFYNSWNKYMDNIKVPTVWTPFYHLKSESFWHFKSTGDDKKLLDFLDFGGTPSIGKMRKFIKYAFLDKDLFQYMENDSCRQKLKDVLVTSFINAPFDGQKNTTSSTYVQDVENHQKDVYRTKNDDHYFVVKSQKGALGIGSYNKDDNTFTLCAGSIISAKVSNSFNRKKKYDEVTKSYCDLVGDNYVLKSHYTFDSPSTASSIVLGRASNGWGDWKDKDGKSLNDIYPRKK